MELYDMDGGRELLPDNCCKLFVEVFTSFFICLIHAYMLTIGSIESDKDIVQQNES